MNTDLHCGLALLDRLTQDSGLTGWISRTESGLAGRTIDGITPWLESSNVDRNAMTAALAVKRAAGQINVVVHAIGILSALPYVLERGEVVHSLSLGAGNTGRAHDLETDRRIAEFKFIEWQGGPESIRQNSLFQDLFNLAEDAAPKRKCLYVVGKAIPLRFLGNRRALSSVLKNAPLEQRFRREYGERFTTVRDYYETVRDKVEIVDLLDVVPWLREAGER